MEQGLQPLVHAVRAEVRVGDRPVDPVVLLGRRDPALLPAERAAAAVNLHHLTCRGHGHTPAGRERGFLTKNISNKIFQTKKINSLFNF